LPEHPEFHKASIMSRPMSAPKRRTVPPAYAPITHADVLKVDQTITLGRAQLQALAFREINVREAFTIVDAGGTFFRASFKAEEGDRGEALVYEQMPSSPESPARITLLCAVLARQKMLIVVQKATELGVMRVVPVLSDHSVQPPDMEKEKPWAWPGQALKASRQCRRASVPEVTETITLQEAITSKLWTDAASRYFLDDEPVPGHELAWPTHAEGAVTPKNYVLAVGPEGGWSARERLLFRDSGATTLRLGSRILRAETAVFAGLSVLQHRLGDLG